MIVLEISLKLMENSAKTSPSEDVSTISDITENIAEETAGKSFSFFLPLCCF